MADTPSEAEALIHRRRSDGLRGILRSLMLDLLAIVWPVACVACGLPDRDCCDPCLEALRRDERRAPVAGELAIPRGNAVPVYAAGAYEGVLRALLVACKHAGRTGFARELGRQLRGPLRAALGEERRGASTPLPGSRSEPDHGPPLLVAVPSRSARVRERGYRHVELIVSAALRGARSEKELRRARPLRALRALRSRRGQVGLRGAERRENADRLAVRSGCRGALRGRNVVVVDDVMTTGASLEAAIVALEGCGARVVAAAVLCAVVRRDRAGGSRGEPGGEPDRGAPDGGAPVLETE